MIISPFVSSCNLKYELFGDEIYAVILKDETVVRELPLHFCPGLEIEEYFSA